MNPMSKFPTEHRESKPEQAAMFGEAWLNRYEGGVNTRPYVPVPLEYYDQMQYLSHEEFGELIRIMMWYSISGEVLPVKGALCHYITRVIDRQNRYYIEWAELMAKRSKAGKKGAQMRWHREECPEEEIHGEAE